MFNCIKYCMSYLRVIVVAYRMQKRREIKKSAFKDWQKHKVLNTWGL